MFAIAKIAGLSAVLSAGIVTAYELPPARQVAPVSGKVYTDRILPADERSLREPKAGGAAAAELPNTGVMVWGKGDRLWTDAGNDCAAQAWPQITRDCLAPRDGTPVRGAVRTITIESREGANVSVLARVPVAEVARR